MPLSKLWAGRAFGTNTGNLFVEIEGPDHALKGIFRFNDSNLGVVVFDISGTFDGQKILLTGSVNTGQAEVDYGNLNASAMLNSKGNLEGRWQTSIGTAGTFSLFPHDSPDDSILEPDHSADQLHTARYHVGPIDIDRDQIIALGNMIQQDFKNARLIITITCETEQSAYFDEFSKHNALSGKAKIVKLYAQEHVRNGLNRIAQVEFGPHLNLIMTQGPDESWVLGMMERLKVVVKRFEKTYVTSVRKFGFGINQLILAGGIVFLPSLESIITRAIFMGFLIGLIMFIAWINANYLSQAIVHLGPRPVGFLTRVGPGIASWFVALAGSVAAALLGAYLKGWLALPGP